MNENYSYTKTGKIVLYFFLFLLASSLKVSAQNSCADYTVTRTTGITYNSIISSANSFQAWRNTGGSGAGGSYDDNRSFSENIGFDFWYLGIRYTSFCVSTNGFIDLSSSTADGTSTGPYGYDNSVFSDNGNLTLLTIAPFYADQVIGGNVNGTDSLNNYIGFLVQGTAPNRTLTVEWYDMDQYSSTKPNLNYQVVLHETTGVIEFNYGTMTNGNGVNWSYSSGINGISMSGTPTAAQLLTQQTANTATFSRTAKNNLSTIPASSSNIKFTPPTPSGNPTNLTFSGLLQTGVTLNWQDHANNEAGYVVYYSVDGINYTFSSQTSANATSTAITGLLPGTTYYWDLYAVTDGHLSSAITGSCTTHPPTVVTSIVTGNWNTNSTWDCNCVPNTNDDVTIANNTTVTINSTSTTASCYSLTVGQGTSGKLIMGSNGTAITLTVTGGMTINSGGTFTTSTTSASHSIIIGGNIVNNGTLNFSGTSTCDVTFDDSFYNNGDQTISGTGATTKFNKIKVDMGNSNSDVLEVTATNFSAATNFLTLTNGTFKLSTGATVTPFNTSTTIDNTCGFWVNNSSAVVNSASGVTITLLGYIRATAGTMTIGGAATNNLISQGGSVIIDGGSLVVDGCFNNSDITTTTNFSMSSGTFIVSAAGSPTATGVSPFDMETPGSTFNVTGGTIIIRNPGKNNLGYTCNGFSGIFSGGTLQIGDGSTAANKTILINTSIDVQNLVISNGVAVTAQITNSLTVNSGITINSGTLDANGLDISLGGDWSNNGTFTGSTGGGNTIFNGNIAQAIKGSSTTTFYDLTINNTSATGVTLSTPAIVNDALALTSGLLNTTTTNILTMLDGSTAPALTAASTSYVNGPLNYQAARKNVGTLNFPIGSSPDCRPFKLTLKHNTTALYNYTAQLVNANPWTAVASTYTDMPATVDTISGVHYWKIDRTNASAVSTPTLDLNGNQTIQLYFGNTGNTDNVKEGSTLTIVKNTSAAPSTWIDIGGTGGPAYSGGADLAGSITSSSSPAAFNSFSTFSLGSRTGAGWNPLPIELLNFSAVPNGEKVDVKWETSTETNNAYFTIEKSKDGVNFTKLIDIPGAGNSTSYKDYAETDYQPYAGTSYYRLKQTDNNGAYKYFNMVPVTFVPDGQQSIAVFPNPVLDNASDLSVKVVGYQNQEVVVVLRDIQGREFLSKVLLSEDENHVFIIDGVKLLPIGSYIVTATSNNKLYNYKLIIK